MGIILGEIILGKNFPVGNYPRGDFLRGRIPLEGVFSAGEGIRIEGNFPVGDFFYKRGEILLARRRIICMPILTSIIP